MRNNDWLDKVLKFRKVLFKIENYPILVVNAKNILFMIIIAAFSLLLYSNFNKVFIPLLLLLSVIYIIALAIPYYRYILTIYSKLLFINHFILVLIISMFNSIMLTGIFHNNKHDIFNYIFAIFLFIVFPSIIYHMGRYYMLTGEQI